LDIEAIITAPRIAIDMLLIIRAKDTQKAELT
jgi:hypothetical protein